MSKISVIMPVYNGITYIENCITSIMDQTYKDFECVVVDDGSTDGTSELIDMKIKDDPRFRAIHTEHKSLSDARNTGIDNTTAPLVLYIDSDDIAHPDMLKKSVAFMNKFDLDMMFFDAEAVNIDLPELLYKGEKHYFKRKTSYGINTGKEMIKRMIHMRDFTYAVFLHVIKRECIKYRYYPKMRAQDYLYTIENMYVSKRIGHLHEVLYYRTCRQNSITYSRRDKNFAWSRVQTLRELMKFIELENIDERDQYEIMGPLIRRLLKQIPCFKQFVSKEDLEWMQSLPFNTK